MILKPFGNKNCRLLVLNIHVHCIHTLASKN